MDHPDIDAILMAIHSGVHEQPRWSTFLAAMQAQTGADYASLVFQPRDRRSRDLAIVSTGAGIIAHASDEVRRLVAQVGGLYDRMAARRPYTLDDIAGLGGEHSRDYLAYLRAHNGHFTLAMWVEEPHGGRCWLSLTSVASGFAPGAAGLMVALAPHLEIAAGTLSLIETERMRGAIAAEAMQRLNFGWLTFDAEGCVLEIDPGAARLLRDVAPLRSCEPGRPFAVGGACRIVSETLAALAGKRSARPRAIHLTDEPWLDMLMVPAAFRTVSGGRAPIAIGYVHGVGTPSAEQEAQLTQLFGLTRSEARLALALGQGRSIVQAGVEQGLTRETARSYSKRVYAKTGARGQADLVRIILASVIALA